MTRSERVALILEGFDNLIGDLHTIATPAMRQQIATALEEARFDDSLDRFEEILV